MQLKKIIKCGKKYIVDEAYRFDVNSYFGFYNNISDKNYIEKEFYYRLGKVLDLENPQTFNEKLQWLKLYDRKPEYTKMVDKYQAKKYVAEKIGEEYIIPTLGVWNRAEEIEWEKLPDKFVLKATHDSGGLVICRDKNTLDKKAAINKLNKSLKTNYYLLHREWSYKDVPRKIIAEKFMTDKKNDDLKDYKFYCFNGEPQFLYLSEGMENHATAKVSFVNLDWTFANFGRTDYSPFLELPPKPLNLEKMIKISRKLSEGIKFLRVDLYEINEKIYFGELTFCPCAGMMPFSPVSADLEVGRKLQILGESCCNISVRKEMRE